MSEPISMGEFFKINLATPMPMFSDETAIDFASKNDWEYVFACLSRMYGAYHPESEVQALREALKIAEDALDKIDQHCLCRRNLKGFDYHEVHRKLGKPESGSRWFTPIDITERALTRISEIKKANGIL